VKESADMATQYVENRGAGYWVAGTRVSLDSVVFAFRDGLSPESIAVECFPCLSLEQVYGAITFYLAHRVEIDKYLQNADAEFAKLRRATRKADPDFHKKLVQSRRRLQMAH
jgi:uncharacterized protein (DUF433 family)